MISNIKKHSIVSSGRWTSISLEDAFWKSFKEIARDRGETLSNLIAQIDADRQSHNLSSAIRLFVLRRHRDQLDQRGGTTGSLGPSKVEDEVQLGFDFDRS
jgi:predicted DNA-binding ribbon-helix-helix protein